MSFELLIGPPGSGKTRILLERARELASLGKRVWWAGLPGQRAGFYRRATADGALLGLEFQTLQQVYYRLLAHAQLLKPLVVGTGRLALVGEALSCQRGGLPAPGEARLFAGAIAEAKRFGLDAGDLPTGDAEVERLRVVYEIYERLKGAAWDYDDFRRHALGLAESGEAALEADALFVDGMREIGPLDMRLLRALAVDCEVKLALPEAPAGCEPDRVLTAVPQPPPQVYEAPNPVAESRWVLRAIKRDLASGIDPLDLAVVIPRGESVAFAALADEYGVPVMDESPVSLADSAAGQLLLDLLALPDYPTPSRLLAIRELRPLVDSALDLRIAGREALGRLSGRLGLADVWHEWSTRLEAPDDGSATAVDDWARWLVDLALESAAPPQAQLFRDQALARAKEASRVARGPGLRSWWAALLKEPGPALPRPGGVALLDERLASGRRYRRAYLSRAVEGVYRVGEHEDYFVPEEDRVRLTTLFSLPSTLLPRRFEGRDRTLFAELRALADEVTITFPKADQSGPLLAEGELIAGQQPSPLPDVPPGSRLEVSDGEPFRPEGGTVQLAEPSLEDLRRYDECSMRFWLESRLPESSWEDEGWSTLVADLTAEPELTPERLAALGRRHEWAADWLSAYRQRLSELRFGLLLPEVGDGPKALLHAALRKGRRASLYHFTAPGAVASREEAADLLDNRWNELWAAGYLLRQFRGRIERVQVVVWPLLGDPYEAYDREGIDYPWKRIVRRLERAQLALDSFREGRIVPSPGYRCSECRVRDICREGAR